MSRISFFSFCCAALLIAKLEFGATAKIVQPVQKLVVQEEPERIVLGWSGPIAAPMREQIASAIEKYKSDSRPLTLALNSPGGSIGHGREVMEIIRAASELRKIETVIEKGGVCASMCVPIYLIGAKRTADPEAHFMFHKASLDLRNSKVSASDREIIAHVYTALEGFATDSLFDRDMANKRVDRLWLARMRAKIDSREIWLTGQKLVDEGSGVIDALVPSLIR